MIQSNICISIADECVALSCQVTKKLKQSKNLELNTNSDIIFIQCWRFIDFYKLVMTLEIVNKEIVRH